jgi:hypothetical protein
VSANTAAARSLDRRVTVVDALFSSYDPRFPKSLRNLRNYSTAGRILHDGVNTRFTRSGH